MIPRTRSAIRTRTRRALNAPPLPLGYPGMMYPRPDSNRHRPASPGRMGPRGASDPDRTGYFPGTSRARYLQCFTGMRAGGGSRTRMSLLTRQERDRSRITGEAPGAGIEPTGSAFKARPRTPAPYPGMERATGFEPAIPGWKPGVSPQHFARAASTGVEPVFPDRESGGLPIAEPAMVSSPGIEPGPAVLHTATLTCYAKRTSSGPTRVRTGDLRHAAAALYQPELQAHTSGTGESNPVCLAPKASLVTVPDVPDAPAERALGPARRRCHAIHCGVLKTPPRSPRGPGERRGGRT